MNIIKDLKFIDEVLRLGGVEDAHRLILALIERIKSGTNGS